MSRVADFRCLSCESVESLELPRPERSYRECASCRDACGGEVGVSTVWVRVWSPVGVGSVGGAGGSPARSS